jgi:hypothetical protein
MHLVTYTALNNIYVDIDREGPRQYTNILYGKLYNSNLESVQELVLILPHGNLVLRLV